jgi:hypothetical protein
MEKSLNTKIYLNKRTCHLYFGAFFFYILGFLSLSGCYNENQAYEYSIEFDNLNLKNLSVQSWLEIDGTRICHAYDPKSAEKCGDVVLPTYKYIEFQIEGKKQISVINKIDLSIQLYSQFFKNNEDYAVKYFEEFMSLGRITFIRKDKQMIHIKHSKGYPLKL